MILETSCKSRLNVEVQKGGEAPPPNTVSAIVTPTWAEKEAGQVTVPKIGPQSTIGEMTQIKGVASLPAGKEINLVELSLYDATAERYLSEQMGLNDFGLGAFDQTKTAWIKARGSEQWMVEVPDRLFTEGHQYIATVRITDTQRTEYTPPPLQPFFWDATPPTVSGVTSSQATQDNFVNAAEKASSLPLVGGVIGQDIANTAYALVHDSVPCDENREFSSHVPLTSEPLLVHGSSIKICIRALDSAKNAAFFLSDAFTVDTDSPVIILPSTFLAESTSVSLSAQVTGALSYAWSQESGPSGLGFLTPSSVTTLVSTSVNGTYQVKLAARDLAGNQTSATAVVTWNLTPIRITSVALAGAALDGYLNATERLLASPVLGSINVSGASEMRYAIAQSSQVCDESLTYLPAAPLANNSQFGPSDGSYKVCIKLMSSQGLIAFGVSPEIKVDTSPPQVEAGPNVWIGSLYSRTGVVSGTGPHSVQWSQVSGSGSLVFGSPSGLTTTITADSDGVYTVRLTAVDAAGNTASDTFNLTWDSIAPTFTELPLANAAVDGSINAVEKVTTSSLVATPIAAGYDAAFYKVMAATQSCTTATEYSSNPPTPQNAGFGTDGAYKVCIKLTDLTGHITYGSSRSIILDTQAPTVTPWEPVVARTSIHVSAQATGATTYQWAKISGPGMVSFGSANAPSTSISADQDGAYTLRLTASDEAGNAATSDLALTWDTTPPIFASAPLSGDVADGYLNSAEKLNTTPLIGTIEATGYSSASYALVLAGANCQGPLVYGAIPLSNSAAFSAEGDYKVCVKLLDGAGNSAIGSSPNFSYDRSPPTDVSAGEDRLANSTITLTGSAHDGSSYLWQKVSGPGGLLFGSERALTTTVSADSQGAYVIRLIASDAAGNSASATMTFTWDTTAPVFTSTSLSGDLVDGYINISERSHGSALLGALVAEGYSTASYAVIGAGDTCGAQAQFQDTIPTGQHAAFSSEGNYKFCIKLLDHAGNATFGTSSPYTVDLTPPSVDVGSDETSGVTITRAATVVGAVSQLWSKESGEGNVTFGSPSDTSTTISADNASPYTIRLTATDAAGNHTSRQFILTWETGGPIFSGMTLSGAAADGYVNQSEQSSTDPLVSNLVASGYIVAAYAVAPLATSCAGIQNYSSSVPLINELTGDGDYKVCVKLLSEGNLVTYGSSPSLVLDTTPPVVSAGESKTARITISQQGVVTGGVTFEWLKVSGPGTLMIGSPTTPETTLEGTTDGTYVARLRATDAAGNSAAADMTLTWDTTPPVFSALPLANDAGNGYINAIERLNTFPLVGTLSASGYDTAQYKLVLDSTSCNGPLAYGAIPQSNNPEFGTDAGYKVCVKLSDIAGNTAYGASATFQLDTTPPVVNPGSNRSANATITQIPTVTGGATYLWSKDSGPGTVTFGSPADKDTTIAATTEGTYQLRLTSTDAAGNSASEVMTLVWDLTAPAFSSISLVGVATDSFLNSSEWLQASPVVGSVVATGYDLVSYAVTSLAVCDNSLNYSADTPLANHSSWGPTDGPYRVCVKLMDNAGNVTLASSSEIVLDTMPPTISAGSAVAAKAQVIITGNASGATTFEWTQISGPGQLTLGSPSSLSTSVSADLDGLYTLRLTAHDQAGNKASSDVPFTWDTVPPVFTSLTLGGVAVDDFINNAEKSSTTTLVGTLSASGHAQVTYKLASQSTLCSSATDYGTAPQANATDLTSDGTYKICARLEDEALNVSYGASSPFIVDTSNPTLGFDSPGAVNSTNAADFNVSGTCSEATRTVSLSGATSAVTTCVNGTFAKSLNLSTKSDGQMVLKADLTDAAGNSATQATVTLTKDTQPPVVTIKSAGFINALSASAYPVTGTCSENSRPVLIGGSVTGEAICSGGLFDVNLNYTGLADGPITITARMTDAAGNTSTLATATLIKNTSTPTVSITNSGFVNAAQAAAYTVTGACSESGQPVTLGGTKSTVVSCLNGVFSTVFDYSTETDGAIVITAAHASSVGNNATPASVTLTKDTQAPGVLITNSGFINASNVGTYSISGTCSEESRFVVIGGALIDTAPCLNGAFTKSLDFRSIPEGPVVVTANITDAAGNPAITSSVNLTKDTNLPTITISNQGYINALTAAAYTVSGSCSEDGRTITIGGTLSSSTLCNQGSFSLVLNFAPIDTQAISITANLSDTAGNAAIPAFVNLTKDITPPTVTLNAGGFINLGNVSSYTVSGTCTEEGRTVSIGGAVSGTASCNQGLFTATLDYTSTANGTVTITATQSDAAGNAANQATITVTKDTILPTVTVTNSGFINASQVGNYTVTGTCSENAQAVTIGGSVTGSTTCASGSFSLNLDYTSLSNGQVTITANHGDAAGNSALPASITLTKDTMMPSISLANPGFINASQAASFEATGTCSENGQTVIIEGAVTSSTTCNLGTYRVALDFSSLVDGPKTITARHTDAAGNVASMTIENVILDTMPPLVDAGSDASVNATFTQTGVVTGATTFLWTKVSGPGTLTFGSANALATTISASSNGTYTVRLTATDAAGNTASDTVGLTWDTVPTKLAFRGPANVGAGICSNALTVARQNAAGLDTAAGSAVNVTLGSTSGGGYYSNATCTTAITTLSIGANASTASVYYMSTAAGAKTLTASAAGLSNGSFTLTVDPGPPTQLTLTAVPAILPLNTCSTAVTVQSRDALQNSAPFTASTPLAITGLGSAALYTDAACTVPATNPAMALGSSTATFYLKDSVAEDLTLSLAATGLTTASARIVIYAGPATKLALQSSANIAVLNCDPVTIEGRDANNKLAPFGSAVTASLARTGSTLIYYSTSSCTGTAITSLTLAINDVSKTVYMRNTAVENTTLSASATGLTTGTRTITVDPLSLEWTGPSSVAASTCSPPLTLTLKDTAGTTRSVNTSFTVSLNSLSLGVFYSDPLCTTAITSRSWTSGRTVDTVYFKDLRAETQTLTASATGVNTAALPLTTTAASATNLRISGPGFVKRDRCYDTFSLWSLDNNGNPAPVTASTAVTISGTGGASFYSDQECTVALTSPTLAAGTSVVRLYFRGAQVEDLTITPTAQGFSAQALSLTVETLPARELALGEEFTCALTTADGTVRCWGANSSGQLGMGDTLPRTMPPTTPIDFGGGRRAIMIGTGRSYACALLDDGAVMCWGANAYSQLGDGTNTNRTVPVPISFGNGVKARSIALGTHHSCAILSSGDLRCWGLNTSGRLGNGNEVTQPLPVAVDLGPGRTAKQVALGVVHTCAILDDDSLKCWGYAGSGRLGNGANGGFGVLTPPSAPVRIDAGRWVKGVALGESHTCALLDNDSLTCWGLGNRGQLGRGNTSSLTTPPGAISLGAGKTVEKVVAGLSHTCALLNDRSVRCWGSNASGALGVGTDQSMRLSPPTDGLAFANGRVPTDLWTSGFGDHTCAVLDSDDAVCWGANNLGQLGLGTSSLRLTPSATAVDLGTGTMTPKVVAGLYHTCVLRPDGSIACFGSGDSGRLGYGESLQRSLMPTGGINLGGSAMDLAAGSNHTCALLTAGTVRCWGNNDSGQLGDGSSTTRTAPVTVDLGTNRTAKSVSTGSFHSCAIMDDDTLSCWGSNGSYRLGVGSTASTVRTPTPVVLGPGVTVKKVSTGESHSCAIFGDDTAKCWGSNSYGQLATGDTTNYETPASSVAIENNAFVRDIVAVNANTCILFLDYSLKCYGYTYLGIGGGTTGLTESVGAGRYAKAIYANTSHEGRQVCAILDDNSVKCWGSNASGQLGLGHQTDLGSPAATPIDLGAGRYPRSIGMGRDFICAALDNNTLKCWGYGGLGQLGDTTSGVYLTPPSTPIVFP